MLDYKYVTSAEDLPAIANSIVESEAIGLDLETTSLDPYQGIVRLLSLKTCSGVYVIDVFQTGTLEPIISALNNPMRETGRGRPIVIGQNLNFDQKYLLHQYNCRLWPIFDTWKASSLIYNGKIPRGPNHNLYEIYRREMPELRDLMKAEDWGASDWSVPNLSKGQLDYAAEDVTYMDSLWKTMRGKLKSLGLMQCALLEFSAGWAEVQMELNGIPFNAARWTEIARMNERKASGLRDQLLGGLPHPYGQMALPGMGSSFNLDSGPQALASLRRLGLEIEDTQEETLAMVASQHALVKSFIEYRKATKNTSTYGQDFLKWIHPVTGRLHTHYYPFTETGRYASSSPNLQTVPRLPEFRDCYEAEAGWTFVLADYSQIELRMLAEYSRDAALVGIFGKQGLEGDPHCVMAASLLNKLLVDITKDERQMAKPVNFGFAFGLGAKRLVIYAQMDYGVTLTEAQATAFRRGYFKTFPGVKRWQDVRYDEGKRTRMSGTSSGRIRYLDPRAHNEYLNVPIQGSCADGLKNSLSILEARLRREFSPDEVKLTHMVHDEIITRCRDDAGLIKRVKAAVSESMVEGMERYLKAVPVEAVAETGRTLAEAKDSKWAKVKRANPGLGIEGLVRVYKETK